jgi:methylphosphotriester-DNA--protein-cysteine methyltransferase
MTPGRYTELFFLDEATALAAGHRPCAECQRARFNHFREIWAKSNPETSKEARPLATAIDAILQLLDEARLTRRSNCAAAEIKTRNDPETVTEGSSQAGHAATANRSA